MDGAVFGDVVAAAGWREKLVPWLHRNARQFTTLAALALVWGFFAVTTEGLFFTTANLSNLLLQTTATAITGIAMVLIVVAGHMDLSAGSVLGFCGTISALCLVKLHWGLVPSILAALATGVLIGVWHGLWIAYRRVPAFVVTLASALAFRGGIIGATGGDSLSIEQAPLRAAEAFKAIGQGYLPTFGPAAEGGLHDTSLALVLILMVAFCALALRSRGQRQAYGLPVPAAWQEWLRMAVVAGAILAGGSVLTWHLGIPWSVVLVLALALGYHFLARRTLFGRYLYAIGGNGDASRFSGIHVQRCTMGLFALMGAMTGLAGVVYTSRVNAATTSAGIGAEMDAVAAAVLGGASLAGGEGSIGGAVLGALIMGSLDNGMSLMNLDVTAQYVVKGLVVLLAVWLDVAQRKR